MEAYDIEAKLLSVQTRLLYIQDINCNPSGNQQEDIQYIYIYKRKCVGSQNDMLQKSIK